MTAIAIGAVCFTIGAVVGALTVVGYAIVYCAFVDTGELDTAYHSRNTRDRKSEQ